MEILNYILKFYIQNIYLIYGIIYLNLKHFNFIYFVRLLDIFLCIGSIYHRIYICILINHKIFFLNRAELQFDEKITMFC